MFVPPMSSNRKWIIPDKELPSVKMGLMEIETEMKWRYKSANLIQETGIRLNVPQICINTASVYMHKFYTIHSFTIFSWISVSRACIYLACKIDGCSRKILEIIRISNNVLNGNITADTLQHHINNLLMDEHVLIQTLAFDFTVVHPHVFIIRTMGKMRSPRVLKKVAYVIASKSLLKTKMCLKYSPGKIACFCIKLVADYFKWQIPSTINDKPWFHELDDKLTEADIEQMMVTYAPEFQHYLVMFAKTFEKEKITLDTVDDDLLEDVIDTEFSSEFSFSAPSQFQEEAMKHVESLPESGSTDHQDLAKYDDYDEPILTRLTRARVTLCIADGRSNINKNNFLRHWTKNPLNLHCDVTEESESIVVLAVPKPKERNLREENNNDKAFDDFTEPEDSILTTTTESTPNSGNNEIRQILESSKVQSKKEPYSEIVLLKIDLKRLKLGVDSHSIMIKGTGGGTANDKENI